MDNLFQEQEFLTPDEMLARSLGTKMCHEEHEPETGIEASVFQNNAVEYYLPERIEITRLAGLTEEQTLPDKKMSRITPIDLQEDDQAFEQFLHQLDLGPLLKKSDIDSPEEILSPDEIETEEEFVSHALAVGTLVNERYKIVKILQESRIQTTYLVKDVDVEGKKLILKELLLPELPREELTARKNKLRDISRLLLTYRHSNLAAILDQFSFAGREYCLIEYFEGLDLEKILTMAVKPFNEKELMSIGSQLCEAVEFLHYRPTPFTLDTLEPHHVIIGLDRVAKVSDYDFTRFFDPERNIEFLPDNPQSLYGDMTKLARVFYFLLTKKKYDPKDPDREWPEKISPKMKKFLETACTEGQRSFGDIKAFRQRFLDTQIEEEEVVQKRKFYQFPLHTIDLKLLLDKVIDFDRKNSMAKVFVATFLIFLGLYALVLHFSAPPGFKRPKTPVTFIVAGDELRVYDPMDYQLLYSQPIKDPITMIYPAHVRVELEDRTVPVNALLVGYANKNRIDVIDAKTLKPVTSIQLDCVGIAGAIPDQTGRTLYIFSPESRTITRFSLDRMKPVDTILTPASPIDVCYIPAQKRESVTGGASTPGSVVQKDRNKTKGTATIEKAGIAGATPTLAVTSGIDNSISLINPETGMRKGYLRLEGKPGKMAVSPDNKRLCVLNTEGKRVVVYDTTAFEVTAAYKLSDVPSGIAVDGQGTIWVTLPQKSMVGYIDPSTGRFNTIQYRDREPSAMHFDTLNKNLWIINGKTMGVAVVDPKDKKVLASLRMGKYPSALGIETSLFASK